MGLERDRKSKVQKRAIFLAVWVGGRWSKGARPHFFPPTHSCQNASISGHCLLGCALLRHSLHTIWTAPPPLITSASACRAYSTGVACSLFQRTDSALFLRASGAPNKPLMANIQRSYPPPQGWKNHQPSSFIADRSLVLGGGQSELPRTRRRLSCQAGGAGRECFFRKFEISFKAG